jgi:ribosomal protein S18 acetylase RimI-like enzyme
VTVEKPIHVRPARPEEFPLLEGMPHALHYNHHLSFIRHALGTKDCLVAEVDGKIAGFAVWDRGFYARPFLWMLGVDPARQHEGIASALIENVEKLNAGLNLYTSTNESNSAMQGLLGKRGFTAVGRLENLDPGDPEIFYFKPL